MRCRIPIKIGLCRDSIKIHLSCKSLVDHTVSIFFIGYETDDIAPKKHCWHLDGNVSMYHPKMSVTNGRGGYKTVPFFGMLCNMMHFITYPSIVSVT